VAIGGGYTVFAGFPVVHQKITGFLVDPQSKTEEPKTEMRQLQIGLTGGEHRSNRCATMQSRDIEAEDTRRDRKACVEAKQVAVAGHPSDGAMTKISDFILEGHVSLIS
jgi:hypothetical protein